MGSDSEIEIKRHQTANKTADEGAAVTSDVDFDANHHTITGIDFDNDTAPGATSPTATTAPPNNKTNDDEPDDDDKVSGTFFERLLNFFAKATPFARAMRFILWGSFSGLIGAALYFYNPDILVLSVHSIPSHFNCAAFCLIGYGIILGLLHAMVIFAHKQPSLYKSSLLHWITEFEEHLAAGLWVTSLLGLFANIAAPEGPADIATNWDYFFKMYLLAGVEPKNHVRLCCVALVIIVFTAVKRHFMHKLALQFNYSNYCDRVEESLFIEGILQSLNKARSAYKFRKRWKLFLNEPTRSPHTRKPNFKSVNHPNAAASPTNTMHDFVHINNKSDGDTLNLKEFSNDPINLNNNNYNNPFNNINSKTQTSPIASDFSAASPTFIEISSPSPTNKTLPHSHPQTTTTSSNNSGSPPASTTNSFVSDSEKKRQFEEFSRLCNRTATQFDSLSGADIRVEIHRESRRIAAQLFKWISNPQRGDISPADLEPFIENQADLFRFLGILRRTQKQSPQNIKNSSSSPSSSPSFSEGDFRRAIDAALQERYGLAKSMETIEMALGKIDSILNILLLVLVASLVERLFFSGGVVVATAASAVTSKSTTAQTIAAPQPLFSITTIFFSTSFFFKDVAKSTFESIIFLLIIHPFDIGDRVLIKLDTTDSKAGSDGADNLIVVEMNLMSTVFERWDGVRIYVPNSVLSTKPIYNIRRSGPTNDLLKLAFAHSTRIDQLEALRLRLIAFLRQNRQDFNEFHRVNVDSLENCNRILVTIVVQHASNWQDLELQMARRTKVLSFIRSTIEDLQIVYLPPIQRVQLLQPDGEYTKLLP